MHEYIFIFFDHNFFTRTTFIFHNSWVFKFSIKRQRLWAIEWECYNLHVVVVECNVLKTTAKRSYITAQAEAFGIALWIDRTSKQLLLTYLDIWCLRKWLTTKLFQVAPNNRTFLFHSMIKSYLIVLRHKFFNLRWIILDGSTLTEQLGLHRPRAIKLACRDLNVVLSEVYHGKTCWFDRAFVAEVVSEAKWVGSFGG